MLATDTKSDPASFVAVTIMVAQAVMIVASIVAMRWAEMDGCRLVLLVSFLKAACASDPAETPAKFAGAPA